ncbi:hypothetical protein [Amycolatopsis samaneae]|uniref:Uncharacterized protein n=1 Tax=Amycolatopsis samaneae TaxID=664691 RepID=A0ABW5GK82_9PSEU
MFAHQEQLDAQQESLFVRPGFRELVEGFLRGQWREPVIALRLSDNKLTFEVPGRRGDGTVEGENQVGRFFGNALRGVGTAAAAVFAVANSSGGSGGPKGKPEAHVRGPANAMALDLVDRLRGVSGPWLAFSPSYLAAVDTGSTFRDPADAPAPRILWQARKPQAPEIRFRGHTLVWPDGSSFRFPLHGRTEDQYLRQYLDSLGNG